MGISSIDLGGRDANADVFQTPTKSTAIPPSLYLELTDVNGITTTSPNGFGYSLSSSSFAYCAGSVAVLARVDDEGTLSKTFYRAKTSADPLHSSSQYNGSCGSPRTPDGRAELAGLFSGPPTALKSINTQSMRGKTNISKHAVHEKSRAITCLTLSDDGSLLAIGETGYNPRVLIFSTKLGASATTPQACLFEHDFGIRCLAFSADRRWLCSIGDSHDGFVHVWQITPTGAVKLHSSNKCTSEVNAVTWLGNSIITVGIRHVKVWRLEMEMPASPLKGRARSDISAGNSPSIPSTKLLNGRNCLLGPLRDSMFTCIAPISHNQAIICTEKGELCILKNDESNFSISNVFSHNTAITCCCFDSSQQLIYTGGRNGSLYSFSYPEISDSDRFESIPDPKVLQQKPDASGYIALAILNGIRVSLTANRNLAICVMSGTNVQDIQGSTSAVPSHKSPVLGISLLAGSDGRANGYLTWSADGMIMFWTGPYACKRRIHLPVTEEISEDNTGLAMLKSIKQLSTEAVLLIGDSMGTLRICSIASQIDDEHPFGETALFSPHNIDYTTVAHDGEIMDICCTIFGGNQHIIMTAGRDRTIQAYLRNSSGSTDLVQTIKQHTSAVTQVMVTKSGGILVSSSADRTVIIHTLACTDSAIAYIPIRTLALKAASLAMNLESMDPEFFFISTSDKQLHRYSMSESSLTKGLRIIGQEKEAQNLTRMTMHDLSFGNNNYNLILGVSTSDNTVKIVSSETGRTIAKEHANCEGITGCVMLPALNQDGHRTCNIITAGLDGTVMAWTIRQDTQGKNGIVKGIDSFSSTPKLGPPIRRILSRSKLAEFAKVLDARGDVSLPTTPIRNSSPSRPSNKAPRNTIVKTELSSTATARNTKYDPPLEAMDASSETTPPQSPSHKRPTCRGGTIKRPSLIDGYRTRSASNIHAHAMNHCMKQLCQQLRGFREEISKASKNYDTDLRNNLMQELRTTMNLLSDSTPELEYHMNGQLGELLDRYSTRLTKLVEEKISDAAPKIINSSDPIDTSSVHDTVPGRSPLARDSPTP